MNIVTNTAIALTLVTAASITQAGIFDWEDDATTIVNSCVKPMLDEKYGNNLLALNITEIKDSGLGYYDYTLLNLSQFRKH